MAHRTRKRSSDPEESIQPTPRCEKASPDHSRSVLPPPRKSARFRQSTLTQIVPEVSFLSRGLAREDSEEEDEESARRPAKRRRRRIRPSQKTLTQIGWTNPLRVTYNHEEEDDEGEDVADAAEGKFENEVLPSDDDEYDHVVAVEEIEIEVNADDVIYGCSDDGEVYQEPEVENHGSNLVGMKDTPKTPRRHRRREIPSSQTPLATPLTPWSVLRKRINPNARSPLEALSTNSKEERQGRADMPPRKLSSPLKRRSERIATNEITAIRAPELFSKRSHASESQDLKGTEEEESEMTGPRDMAIGEETQAMIHQINAACGPDLIWEKAPRKEDDTPQRESRSGNSSQASRSFNFDEEDEAVAAPLQDKKQAPSPTLGKSAVLAMEEDKGEDVEEEEEEDEDVEDEFPTPRAPPPTQASQVPTQIQLGSSEPLALQHPSQVSTVAETTQATPPRATPRQRNKSRSQRTQTRPTPREGTSKVDAMWPARSSSQETTTEDPARSQVQNAQLQDERIPESPLRPSAHHASSPTRQQRCKTAPTSLLEPLPRLSFTSSPVSSPVQRGAGGPNNGYGDSNGDIDGVISATQMLPASLMEYSLPRPPTDWDASSAGWLRSSMLEEDEEGG